MSKSLQRVMDALTAAKMGTIAIEMPSETRTAAQAAEAASCELDQIAKSIIFAGAHTGALFLFITAGGNQVDPDKAALLAGERLERAHPGVVRDRTGFAIGGVSPVGHLEPVRSFIDPRLASFGIIYAAAGTPRHIFAIAPDDLLQLSGATSGDFVA